MYKRLSILTGITFLISILSCDKGTEADAITPTSTAEVPAVFTDNFKAGVTLSSDGTNVTLKSNGTPDHVTPYWGTGNAMYEAQRTGYSVTPGALRSQNYVMTIPVKPQAAATKEATSLGPIGMALNGVAIFNDREGGNVPVEAGVARTFDRSGAHSGPGGVYHYHVDGDFTSKDDAKLIGYLRDGFPIYGRRDEDGSYPANLDDNGGHIGVTTEYAEGIYHYHASNVNYLDLGIYVLKSGSYHGTKGTFTF